MPAFKVDYRLVRWTRWLIIIAGLAIWAVRRANNAMNYREVAAEVERIDEVCVPLRASVSEATDCATASARAGGKRLRHYRAVRVRYTSPADGQMHSGVVIPTGGDKAVEASQLRPGDRWTIMAHDDKAEVIKAD